MSYDFSTLNDKDLEELALDLLNAELNLGLQSFKVGKDGGIDLRYSTPENNNEIVVQVKHYLKSGEARLIKEFKEKELPKVRHLKPTRYIIVTSIGLSNVQKDDLKKTFEPFIQSSNDVFAKDNLNALLRKHKDVEKKHFKLWFSSTEILSGIFNNGIEGRSKSYLKQIRIKVPLYVLTENFDAANKTLEKEKLLVITGMPGIGKTTLADILLLERARQNHKIYIINSIREAEDVISVNEDEKQVFYFDDFLGEVYYEILTGSQKESDISKFINRIVIEPNKYLVLSTRTVILEQAKNKSEKIKRARIDVAKYEIELSNYSIYEKAKILYNHLFFREVKQEFIKEIVNDKFYNRIINHKYYTPRLIEFFTDEFRLSTIEPNLYRDFILHNLNHPEEIWKDSINNQISYLDKCFLYTLFSFRNSPYVSDLKRSFDKRLAFEIEANNQQRKINQFDESIKNLLNGFIYVNMTNVDYRFEHVRFINPSISDFLLNDLKTNEKEKEAIINSIIFIEQLEIFDKSKTGISLSKELQTILLKKITSNLLESLHTWIKPLECKYLRAIIKYCSDINYDDEFLAIFEKLEFEKLEFVMNELVEALMGVQNAPKSTKKIQEVFFAIINQLLTEINLTHIALKLPELFKLYEFDFNSFTNSDNGNEKITGLIIKLVEKTEEELYENYKDSLLDNEDTNSLVYDELENLKNKLIENLNPGLMIDVPRLLTNETIEEQITKNQQNVVSSEKRTQELRTYHENEKNQLKKIDDLFYIEEYVENLSV